MKDKLDIFEILGAEHNKTDKKDQGQAFVSDPDFNEAIKRLRELNEAHKPQTQRKVDVAAAMKAETARPPENYKPKNEISEKTVQPKKETAPVMQLPAAEPVKMLAQLPTEKDSMKTEEAPVKQPKENPAKQHMKKAAEKARERAAENGARVKEFLKEEHVAPSKKKQMLKGLTVVAVLLLIFTFIINVPKVSGSSMKPFLENGDRIVVNLLARNFEAGDIIVFKTENGDKLVKRIIAGNGDVVNITDDNKITVNGEAVEEEYVYTETTVTDRLVSYPVIIDGDEYFVLGDNRTNSKDSRNAEIGLISEEDVMGKVIMCIRKF